MVNRLKLSTLSMVIMTLFFSCDAYAVELIQHEQEEWCKKQKLGWNFYCDERKKDKVNTKQKQVKPQIIKPTIPPKKPKIKGLEKPKITKDVDPQEITRKQNEHLEYLRAEAVVFPTTKHIKDYIIYQREIMNQAAKFASVWQRAIWQNPKLDYTQKHPTARFAASIQSEEQSEKQTKFFKSMNQRYGLFYFYDKGRMSQLENPIFRAWTLSYTLNVLAVSMDHSIAKEFKKETVFNTNQAKNFGINDKVSMPVIMLFDNITRKIIPVGYGYLSQEDLTERIYNLTNIKVGQETN